MIIVFKLGVIRDTKKHNQTIKEVAKLDKSKVSVGTKGKLKNGLHYEVMKKGFLLF